MSNSKIKVGDKVLFTSNIFKNNTPLYKGTYEGIHEVTSIGGYIRLDGFDEGYPEESLEVVPSGTSYIDMETGLRVVI